MDDVMLTDEVVMDYHSCALVLKSTSLGTYFLTENMSASTLQYVMLT